MDMTRTLCCVVKEGELSSTLFLFKQVQNKWGGVAPSLFMSIHVQNKWRGVEPSPCLCPFASCQKTRRGEPSSLFLLILCQKKGAMRDKPSSWCCIALKGKNEEGQPLVVVLARTRQSKHLSWCCVKGK